MTNQDEARLEGLRAELGRLYDEQKRIREEIKKTEESITWVKYHEAHPVGSRVRISRDTTFEVVGYGTSCPLGVQVKKDGTLSNREPIQLFWLQA